ncbi:MAG: hypothetical protein LQ340_001026 [Diploschistes diacapsis]|nr:MAG: hypothetical protein LQ340_001026 [Diploschistes diacapsis]
MALPSFVLPGTRLGPASSFVPGSGTHVHESSIVASIKGKPLSVPSSSTSSTKPTLSIATPSATAPTHNPLPSRSVARGNRLPSVSAIVLARVTRLQQRQASVAILVVDDEVCADAFAGVVRREDVRGWEVDKLKVEDMFRVGDVVRAVVISLGDQASYYLSTARNDLGVLLATSEDGNRMYPVSWKEFRDPLTGKHEARKVAKPI